MFWFLYCVLIHMALLKSGYFRSHCIKTASSEECCAADKLDTHQRPNLNIFVRGMVLFDEH